MVISNTFKVLKKQEGPLKASGPKKLEKKVQIRTKNGLLLFDFSENKKQLSQDLQKDFSFILLRTVGHPDFSDILSLTLSNSVVLETYNSQAASSSDILRSFTSCTAC